MLDTGENSEGGRFQPKKSSSVEELLNFDKGLCLTKICRSYFRAVPNFRLTWPSLP